jgi:preprotein translocase subunit SecG
MDIAYNMSRRGWILALYFFSVGSTIGYLWLYKRGYWGQWEFWRAAALSVAFAILAIVLHYWYEAEDLPLGRGFEIEEKDDEKK